MKLINVFGHWINADKIIRLIHDKGWPAEEYCKYQPPNTIIILQNPTESVRIDNKNPDEVAEEIFNKCKIYSPPVMLNNCECKHDPLKDFKCTIT